MKTLLLCGDHSNQRALAHKIARSVPLDGLVIVGAGVASSAALTMRPALALRKLCSVTVGQPLRRAWYGMLAHYDAIYRAFPDSTAIHCTDINATKVLEHIAQSKPDLVLVSGTNLLRPPVIDLIRRHGRVMNLHTGISPYVKGGPSCTDWCLARREFALIGNTVMWLDSGIDSGNIIATERTPLTGDESLIALQIAVMEHAHALYVKCIARHVSGQVLADVPQRTFEIHRLFRSRDWNGRWMATAVANHYRYFYRGSPYLSLPAGLRLIGADSSES